VKTYETVSHDALRAPPHSGGAIELKHKAPEVTFLGVNDQPDFATLYITMYPQNSVIELDGSHGPTTTSEVRNEGL
jgi:7-cyano-7-deazaguanine reductase